MINCDCKIISFINKFHNNRNFFYLCVMVKKIRNAVFLLLGFVFISLSGCRSAVEEKLASQTLDLRYATHFSVSETDFGYIVSLYPEGKEEGVLKFALTRNDTCDALRYEKMKSIHIPVGRVATNSGTNFEFLRQLGVLDDLVAACDAKYIYSDTIKARLERGIIRSLGNSYEINLEQLSVAHPDILLLSGLRDDPNPTVCPVVYNFEWKESSALGRAEWIKFISLFFDKWHVADSLFQGIEDRYNHLKAMTDTLTRRPSVFAAGCYGDTWYMTAGQGYMAAMYEDAGGNYILKSIDMPTFTCGTEALLANYFEADYWMNCDAIRLSDIDSRLRGMKSYRAGNVYHFNKRMVPGEGYNITDFYEKAVAQPDVVLADLISVFHPDLLPDHTPVYVGKCKPNE